jgi:hypothetical protein
MPLEVITHRRSGNQVYGTKLVTGEILEISDLYESSDGSWRECPCPGTKVPPGEHVVWVRPLSTQLE